jgi:hypothetical protein
MKKLRTLLISFVTIIGLAVPLVPVMAPIAAADTTGASTSCSSPTDCIGQGVTGVDASGKSANQDDLKNFIKTIVNVLLFILGAIAVIMIIIGGIRYTTSNGDTAQLTAAKNTILYAVIGLVVAILAYAIVNFVISTFSGSSGT